jgi:peptidoglycan/xylan/chitin deacetylase (PgdA/CDA1 family)
MTATLSRRLSGKWRRLSVDWFGRRRFRLRGDVPYVSFTFDDFPLTALTEGGQILARHGVRGTYFVSMKLLGQPSVSGPIASPGDLKALLADGHELGCHTYDHLDGTQENVTAFEQSIRRNQAALEEIAPGARLPVFAYPLDGPTLHLKRAVGRHFVGCRGGGQTFNAGTIDLHLLKAYFLDWRNRENVGAIRDVIERNAAERGWLIVATHDIAAEPSRYGCSPDHFDEVVGMAVRSGSRVVPMMQACEAIGVARETSAAK